MGIVKTTIETGNIKKFKGEFFSETVHILYCGTSSDEKKFKLSRYFGMYDGYSPSINYRIEKKKIKFFKKECELLRAKALSVER